MHTGLFLLYRCHVCTCADLLCPSVCAFLAFHALYGNRQSFHPRIQWACCRYDFRRSALLRDAKSALRIGALLYDRCGRAIECTGKGCEVINIYFFINSHLNYFMLYFLFLSYTIIQLTVPPLINSNTIHRLLLRAFPFQKCWIVPFMKSLKMGIKNGLLLMRTWR